MVICVERLRHRHASSAGDSAAASFAAVSWAASKWRCWIGSAQRTSSSNLVVARVLRYLLQHLPVADLTLRGFRAERCRCRVERRPNAPNEILDSERDRLHADEP
jgi:hypothetical protein